MIELLARAFGGGKSEKPKAGKRINLALQGGGALGAFTWGVLDHLLEDGRLTIEGISGASAGAVNAIILAGGPAPGGRGGGAHRQPARRPRPRGTERSAQASRRFLARGQFRRQPAGPSAPRG